MKSRHAVLAAMMAVLIAACGRTEASEADAAAVDAAAGGATDDVAGGATDAATLVDDASAVTIDATMGGRRYVAAGTGECSHAPAASIYGMPAAMWLVQYGGGGDVQSLSLTLWRPASGAADQLSLSVTADDRTTRISTVEGGRMEGTARVVMETDGDARQVRVDGRDANGDRVIVAVRCPRFAPLEAVGG